PFREELLFTVVKAALGLSYVYEEVEILAEVTDEKVKLTPELLTDVPKAFIKDMNTAVLDGDVERLNGLVEKVKKYNVAAARGLSKLVKQYDYDRLVEIFTSALGR
ncbi:hypothetical protein ACFL2E_12320, partial [Thermodesulfobacteriota bacterium]